MSLRRAAAALALVAASAVLAGCGSSTSADEPVTLDWYAAPDRVEATVLARSCSDASGGAYRIRVHRLPADAQRRHDLLARQLAARTQDIDILSLDSASTPEFAAADYLAPLPQAREEAYARDLFPLARQMSSSAGAQVAVPFWIDTYLTWYRGVAAERAGLDPTKVITWDDLVAGAQRLQGAVPIEDSDGQGTTQWLTALMAGAGGSVLSGSARDPRVGLDSDAGRRAASVVRDYAAAGVGAGPAPGAAATFAQRATSFMIAPVGIVADPDLRPVATSLAWTRYPVVDAESRPPVFGMNLAVPLYARDTPRSYDAISCLTGDGLSARLTLTSGHATPRTTVFDSDTVREGYPMASTVRPALSGGVLVPRTPAWPSVQTVLDRSWSPASSVTAQTPEESADQVRDVLAGRLP